MQCGAAACEILINSYRENKDFFAPSYACSNADIGIGIWTCTSPPACVCVYVSECAERASAPSFGHSDADKCCTRIPNTFLSLAAAAAARANVNAAAADAAAAPLYTVPHVVAASIEEGD